MAPAFRPFILAATGLVLVTSAGLAQRPALTGEKARVAEAVRADLTKLADLQRAHHARTRVYAADARDLSFVPTSGAQVNIAYASMNAWAANATHATLSPVACYVIVSAAEPTGPAAQPFCQEGRPGTTTAAPAPAGSSAAPTTANPSAPASPAPASSAPAPAPQTRNPAPPPTDSPAAAPARPSPSAAAAPSRATTTTPPASAAAPVSPNPDRPRTSPPADVSMSPAAPAAPLRQPSVAADAERSGASPRTAQQAAVEISFAARTGTRDATAAGAAIPTQAENVSATEFSQRLAEFARGAATTFFSEEADAVRVLRDPYESTPEFEARRAAAIAAARRREAEFLQQNSRTYNVAMPIRDVRYDPDREVLEFTVDGVALPVSGADGGPAGAATLALTCYTRPVLWCSPDEGMLYEAGDLWRLPRATARQHDVLRNPLVLHARFAVGRREDARILGVTLLSMDLQARGQSVQRWDSGAR